MQKLASFQRALGLLYLGFLSAALAQPAIELAIATNQVGRYERIEFNVQGIVPVGDPFDPNACTVDVQLTSPTGQRLKLPAFYAQPYERRVVGQRDWCYPVGMPVWKARFAPSELGAYHATVYVKPSNAPAALSKPIPFNCVASTSKGFVRVSRKDPRFLEFSEGSPFFPIGQNLAFIGNQQYVTLSKAENIFTRLATNGANYLRVWTCCEDWATAIEARKSAWGRSWDWRPPLAAMPEQTNLQCLQLSTARANLSVNPSHPVALRPGTRYTVSGKIRTEAGASVRLEVHRTKPEQGLRSAPESAWTAFRHSFNTGPNDFWLDRMSFALEGNGTAWLTELSLKEEAGGPELLWEAALNRPTRGFYNPLDCFLLDQVVSAAEKEGVYLQLCLLTRDLYMNALKEPGSLEYARAIADAKKFFRYAVARWGYSTSVAAWEYWNEMNPGLPTDSFYTALGEYLEEVDIYHHLRTTSTWGPSAKDCRHAKLDFADTHFYLRPADKGRLHDEVEAVLDRAAWLRKQAPNKPAHLGEFGLANDKWQPTEEMKSSRELVDFHNSLWASALSGMTGTGLFWWWDRLDPRNAYPIYRPLSMFVADVPWNSGEIRSVSIQTNEQACRVIGLQTQNRAWLWWFNPAASWANVVVEKKTPLEIAQASVTLQDWPDGNYRVQWYDTREGKVIREDKVSTEERSLRLVAPTFARDLACKVWPQ